MGCHFLLQGIFPDPGIEPAPPPLAGGFFTTSISWETWARGRPILFEIHNSGIPGYVQFWLSHSWCRRIWKTELTAHKEQLPWAAWLSQSGSAQLRTHTHTHTHTHAVSTPHKPYVLCLHSGTLSFAFTPPQLLSWSSHTWPGDRRTGVRLAPLLGPAQVPHGAHHCPAGTRQ